MNTRQDKLAKHFSEESGYYDDLIPKLIPYYFEQSTFMLELVPFDRMSELNVLDLGAGTGILSGLILENFENASVLAYDLSRDMLDECRRKLAKYGERLDIRAGDFSDCDFGSGYDLVISGLAIHHLKAGAKRSLYASLYQAINDGGMLLVRDCVAGATPKLTRTYERLWRDHIKANGEDDAKWFAKYLDEDSPSSLEEQLEWMAEGGFTEVGCHWRYINFAIFSGRREISTR